MEIKFEIQYEEGVIRDDIPKLSSTIKMRVKHTITTKLRLYPEVFGKPLKGSARMYRALRVGNHRVIFRIEKRIVKNFIIGHRSTVYRILKKRLQLR